MPGLLPDVDPDGLLEFSVVYTDRALNHMSARFGRVMREISDMLRSVYKAHAVALVPGSGTFGMEAVARQFATDRRTLVLRHGWFSYRWTQILEMGRIPRTASVLCARRCGDGAQAPWAPPPVGEVRMQILRERPAVVFAPHVETASGLILPDDYLIEVSDAVREVGGLFVLDCIASGAVWVDMRECGVDVLISAPQKGWSGSPCCAMVMLGERAGAQLVGAGSTSFACDLRRWAEVMASYEAGGHAYHTTLPTDALLRLHQVMQETLDFGLERARAQQWALGRAARALLAQRGFASVAAPGWEAPGVVVSYTDDPAIQSGRAFAAQGLQTAAGVPLQCGEGPDFRSFRIGLFGLEKLSQPERSVQHLAGALDRMGFAPIAQPTPACAA